MTSPGILQAISVHRMISRKDKRPLALVLVKAKKEEKGTPSKQKYLCIHNRRGRVKALTLLS